MNNLLDGLGEEVLLVAEDVMVGDKGEGGGVKQPGKDRTWQTRLEFLFENINVLASSQDFPHTHFSYTFFWVWARLTRGHKGFQWIDQLAVTYGWVWRYSALPRGCKRTIFCRTCLIFESRNLHWRSKHLNHPAEPSQLCLCFYNLEKFFLLWVQKQDGTGIFSRAADDSDTYLDLRLFKILQMGFCSHIVGFFFFFFDQRWVTGSLREVLFSLIGPEAGLSKFN